MSPRRHVWRDGRPYSKAWAATPWTATEKGDRLTRLPVSNVRLTIKRNLILAQISMSLEQLSLVSGTTMGPVSVVMPEANALVLEITPTDPDEEPRPRRSDRKPDRP